MSGISLFDNKYQFYNLFLKVSLRLYRFYIKLSGGRRGASADRVNPRRLLREISATAETCLYTPPHPLARSEPSIELSAKWGPLLPPPPPPPPLACSLARPLGGKHRAAGKVGGPPFRIMPGMRQQRGGSHLPHLASNAALRPTWLAVMTRMSTTPAAFSAVTPAMHSHL